ncbi:MAG TPA: hypothetical protein V6D07_19070 [Trichocoleus sp.]
MDTSSYEILVPQLLSHLRSEMQASLGLLTPYQDEGGLEGQCFGLIDFDSVMDDDELPMLQGPAALRQAVVAEGTLLITTFVANHDDAIAKFMQLSLRLRQAIPLIGSAVVGPYLMFRKLDLAGNRQLVRAVSQPLQGGRGSLWTMHVTGQVSAHMIINRNPIERLDVIPMEQSHGTSN